MHRCLASMTTPTPSGLIALSIASSICVVRRSCTCKPCRKTAERVIHVEHRAPQNFLWVLLVAFGQILHRAFHALRRTPQAITLWVLSETDQHFPHEFLQTGTG